MGETELETAPAVGSSRRGAHEVAVRGSRRGQELKVQARGLSFNDGQRLMAPVQMEADPKGKAERDDGQDDRLRRLEGQVEAERAARIAQAEASIVATIARSRLWMEGADDALTRMEGAVEQMLVDDMQRDAAREGVDASVKAYTEAQKPGLLEGLGMLLSLTDTFKSALGLLKGFTALPGVERNAVAPGFIARGPTPPRRPADLGTMAGLGLDASTSAVGAIDSVKGIGGGADATSGMAQALKGYVDSVQGSVGTLQGYVLGRDLAAVGQAYRSALLDHEAAAESAEHLKTGLSEATQAKVRGLLADLNDRVASVSARISALTRMIRARSPGAELAAGTAGRTVFDLVASKPKAFHLHLEQELRVDVARGGDFAAATHPVSYWLETTDARLLERVDENLHALGQLLRPAFATDMMRRLPERVGHPVATLLSAERHDYEKVRLVAQDGTENIVKRSDWEDGAQRERLLWQVIPVERWEDGASTP